MPAPVDTSPQVAQVQVNEITQLKVEQTRNTASEIARQSGLGFKISLGTSSLNLPRATAWSSAILEFLNLVPAPVLPAQKTRVQVTTNQGRHKIRRLWNKSMSQGSRFKVQGLRFKAGRLMRQKLNGRKARA